MSAKQPDSAAPTGAIVLGGDYQGLGIVRSLGRHGVPVCVIDDEHSIARVSRYTGCWARVADLGDEQRLVEDLLRIGHDRGLEGWVLFPTRDETVAAISRNRERLAAAFRVPTAAWETIQWAWDKRKTYELAESLGVPAPRTWRPDSVAALEAIDGQPPFAVKPAIKERFFYETKAKAWRADSAEELRVLVTRAMEIIDPGEVLVQELIPGDGRQQYAYCALCEEGEPLATMVARRLRQHPPEFGRASTYVETVEAPGLEELSARLLAKIRFSGLAELEFKLDPRNGKFKLLDFNARTWGYHTIAGQAGVDFPYLLFRRQLEHPVDLHRARAGVRWVRILTDLPSAIGEIRRGRLRTGPYLRSLRRAQIEAVFSREDPLPGLAEIALIPYLAVKRGL
jgi:predicted ATP-grasp superfamily ATP-dependent carboligase